jgi:translation initiation factor IF-2
VIRNNIVVMDERTLESLKRFKDDVREVRSGMECGLKIAGFDDIKEADVLEFYKTVEVARSL